MRSAVVAAAVALSLTALACGSAGRAATGASPAAGTAPVASTPAVAPAPPSVRILSPAAGARTGESVTVHVRVTGAPRGEDRLRYVLDGVLRRLGATRLAYRELAPGRHRLVVLLADDPRARASTAFTVLAPAAPVPVEQMHTASEPAPAASAPKPAPAPEPTHTTTERKSAPPPPPEEAIPQGNGGDRDSDNNGGPSDGDGNV